MSISLEITILLILVLVNGIFAMTEFAVISARKSKLQHLAEGGNSGAKLALEICKAPQRLLSTIQVGITLNGFLIGALGGAALAADIGTIFNRAPLIYPYGEIVAFLLISALVTYISIVLGELVPKRIALLWPESLSIHLATSLRFLSWLLSPVVWMLDASSNLIMKIFPKSAFAGPPITEEELHIILEQGAEAGIVEEAEEEMAKRALRLGDRVASSLMTPRTEVMWLDAASSKDEFLATIREHEFSHFPVCQDSLDHVLGIVSARKVLQTLSEGKPLSLDALMDKDVLWVPSSINVLRLLDRFHESGQRVAILADEYGGMDGLVTLTDIVEAILGDVPTESEEPPQVVRRDDGTLLVDGGLPLADLTDVLELIEPFRSDDFHTVGGLAMDQLGHIPKAAEHFDLRGFRFEVIDMDGNRVDKVLIKKLPPAADAAED